MSARYGLVGERLSHSFSPRAHALLGNDGYRLIELARDALPAFFAARDFDGVNVTIPYKEAVMPYLDTLSDTARSIGCVNTVVRDAQGRLHGYNTDAYGFIGMVKHAGMAVSGRKCLVLGSGGASKTVCYCLRSLGAREVRVISRTGEDNYGNLERHADAQMIVNATPVGMYPNNGQAPLRLAGFPRLEAVLDLIHNPARTALLLEAERLGIPCENGMFMLAAQAKRATELFFDRKLDDGLSARLCARLNRETANIVLIGMPGSGKTAVGRLLAEKLERPFFDTDDMIAARAGMTCAQYLEKYGEEAFRILETDAVSEAGRRTGCVIASGGGAVTRRENVDALRQNGVLFQRLRPLEELPGGGRPLSATPEQRAALYAQRAPLYEAARDAAVAGASVREAAEEIERLFNARFEAC